MAMFEQMRANVGKLLKGIDRYNPENLATLERYVETQAKENAYDLEANLAVLKLYQFNPAFFQTTVTAQILLKALTNLPHTDFTLCKCMIDQAHVSFGWEWRWEAEPAEWSECRVEITPLHWLVSAPGLGQVSFSLHLITGQTQQNPQPLPGEAGGPVGPALVLACSSVVEPRDGR
ncbi:eukaryotic translation initiation factor 3 subunit K isoform X2 [Marmota monax]|uniref:eukaryotic translation initiation factor 3 subunit K isoform X2 n=1 Tax=Marmota monax TaxID=9995 RepID=UPI0026F2BE75|nr:eukaryotic translation initiation factor 3 subunit K isoform X2 [Marmota monax]